MKKTFVFLLLFALIWVSLLLNSHHTGAMSTGRTNFSGNPATTGGATCTTCHVGGVAPDVAITGPMTVFVGNQMAYAISIQGGQLGNSALPDASAGYNISADGGDLDVANATAPCLSAESQCSLNPILGNNELTHTAPKLPAVSSDTVTFDFLFTAPSTPGTVIIYGAGNSADGMNGSSGDMSAATTLTINVVEPTAQLYLPLLDN